MTATILFVVGAWVALVTIAAWRVFIKRNLDGANLDRATKAMLESLPFLNRKRRRAALKAMRSRNRWERARQGFRSWFGVSSRSRQTYSVGCPQHGTHLRFTKLSTPDTDP